MTNPTQITEPSIFHKSQTLIATTFSPLELGVRNLLILCIHWYQKYLSPRKGYSCAYRSLHHGESCSCYVKNILTEQNLLKSISLAKQRFSECAQAEKILRIRSAENENSLGSDSQLKPEKKSGLYGRRQFIYHGMLGFAMPFFFTRRGTVKCCASLAELWCRGEMAPDYEDDRRRYDN